MVMPTDSESRRVNVKQKEYEIASFFLYFFIIEKTFSFIYFYMLVLFWSLVL